MLKTPRFKSGASQVALVVKDPPANAGDVRDVGSVPGLERDWRRARQPILENPDVQKSLAGYSPWVAKSQT